MIAVAIVTRRLKEDKTYDDFRKAWFHESGFGTSSKLFTMVNAFDPKEITVIGFTETSLEDFPTQTEIDVRERLDKPLDDIIESDIDRKFGLLISEDDFSASGKIEYQPASVSGKETNLNEFAKNLEQIAAMIRTASAKRDKFKK